MNIFERLNKINDNISLSEKFNVPNNKNKKLNESKMRLKENDEHSDNWWRAYKKLTHAANIAKFHLDNYFIDYALESDGQYVDDVIENEIQGVADALRSSFTNLAFWAKADISDDEEGIRVYTEDPKSGAIKDEGVYQLADGRVYLVTEKLSPKKAKLRNKSRKLTERTAKTKTNLKKRRKNLKENQGNSDKDKECQEMYKYFQSHETDVDFDDIDEFLTGKYSDLVYDAYAEAFEIYNNENPEEQMDVEASTQMGQGMIEYFGQGEDGGYYRTDTTNEAESFLEGMFEIPLKEFTYERMKRMWVGYFEYISGCLEAREDDEDDYWDEDEDEDD